MDFIRSHWPFLLAVPAALAGMLALGVQLAKDSRREKLARELELLRRGFTVVGRVLDRHEHGEALLDALLEEERSPEVQSLIASFMPKESPPK